MTPGRPGRHRGRDAAPEKVAGRRDAAAQLGAAAEVLAGWIGDDDRCRGADLSPELVAWIAAYTYHHGPALAELRRVAAASGRSLDGIDPADVPAIIEALIGR
jgi:hypothetical protein